MGVREVRFKHREAKHSLLIIQNVYFLSETLPSQRGDFGKYKLMQISQC